MGLAPWQLSHVSGSFKVSWQLRRLVAVADQVPELRAYTLGAHLCYLVINLKRWGQHTLTKVGLRLPGSMWIQQLCKELKAHPVAANEDLHLWVLIQQGQKLAQRVVHGPWRILLDLCMRMDRRLQVQLFPSITMQQTQPAFVAHCGGARQTQCVMEAQRAG